MELISSLIKKEPVKCVKEIPFLLLVLVLEVVLLCCIFNAFTPKLSDERASLEKIWSHGCFQ